MAPAPAVSATSHLEQVLGMARPATAAAPPPPGSRPAPAAPEPARRSPLAASLTVRCSKQLLVFLTLPHGDVKLSVEEVQEALRLAVFHRWAALYERVRHADGELDAEEQFEERLFAPPSSSDDNVSRLKLDRKLLVEEATIPLRLAFGSIRHEETRQDKRQRSVLPFPMKYDVLPRGVHVEADPPDVKLSLRKLRPDQLHEVLRITAVHIVTDEDGSGGGGGGGEVWDAVAAHRFFRFLCWQLHQRQRLWHTAEAAADTKHGYMAENHMLQEVKQHSSTWKPSSFATSALDADLTARAIEHLKPPHLMGLNAVADKLQADMRAFSSQPIEEIPRGVVLHGPRQPHRTQQR